MNRAQKIAWFNLIVIMTALVLSVIAVSFLHFVVGLPLGRALGGFGFIGICGLTGLSQLLYKKERDKVSFDERDLMILRKASLGAYSIFWFLFVLAAMIPFFVLGPKGMVSVKYLAAMVFGGMIVVVLVQSIITHEAYGWGGGKGKIMNRYQKLAWFNLIVITATILITTAAVAIEIHLRGYSTLGLCFVALLLLLRLKPFLFKKPESPSGVICDERDNFIVKRAVSFAYTTFWIVFFVSSFAVHIFMGMEPDSSVPTITLPLIAVGGALFMKILCSVAILVQYGRTGKGEV